MPPSRHNSFPRPALLRRAHELVGALSTSGRFLFYILAALIVGSSLGLFYLLNAALLIEVPAHGSSYTEGIVGTPRFINPILALSDADHDLSALIYSGLLKPSPSGEFVPDLASSYDVSADGKTYTVHLRSDAKFEDGTPVTSDDVLFTVSKALDPAIKSPLRANWEGIAVAAPDPHTVVFTLQKPYAPFVENLTLGILPKHLWETVNAEEFPFSELNTNPVGSGPYKVSSLSRNASGIPTEYDLSANPHYALGEPYLSRLTLRFYQNEDALVSALKSGDVEAGSGISPASLQDLQGSTVLSAPLSRVFGVFFNQNQSAVLRDAAVRKALSAAVDRQALVKQVLGGYGTPLEGPLPLSSEEATSTATSTDPALIAQAALLKAGWKLGDDGILTKTTGTGKKAATERLAFTLSTGNVPELTAAAQTLKDEWKKMGADVTISVYDQGDLSENVIRPRKYDALLFGEIVGRSFDLFAFWDSSQRNDPGLNIALYANASVDKYVEELRTTQDEGARQSLYQKIAAQITSDMPAVFLYAPDFIYVAPKDVRGVDLRSIENPSDRFETIEKWYRETDTVWGIFAR